MRHCNALLALDYYQLEKFECNCSLQSLLLKEWCEAIGVKSENCGCEAQISLWVWSPYPFIFPYVPHIYPPLCIILFLDIISETFQQIAI